MKFNGVSYDLIRPRPMKVRARKPITREELERLVESIKDKDKEVYWVLKTALVTGARIHEILNLRLRDIKDDYIIFEKTKTGDQRGVWVSPNFIKELKHYLTEEKGVLGAEKCFFTNWKTWSAYIEIRQRLEKMFDKETARRLMRTHNFRRAVINYLLKRTGGNILLVQSFIGHKSIDSTERYVYEIRKEEFAKKASRLLFDGKFGSNGLNPKTIKVVEKWKMVELSSLEEVEEQLL